MSTPSVVRIPRNCMNATCAALFGLAIVLPAIGLGQVTSAPSFTLLYSFQGSSGEYPLAGLVRDSSGNLYGTTSEGGAHNLGTVFKVSATDGETVLHSFKGGPGDGSFSIASLVRDGAGTLYGTTVDGGAFGFGTVFKLEENGDESLLYSFGGHAKDGRYPSAGLLMDSAGNLYGTTQEGGAFGFGTIFKLSDGKETILHSFAGNPTDGQYPVQGLIRDAKGNLYGATELGGKFNDGTIFELSTSGAEHVIFSLTGGPGGNYPYGGVVRDSAGNFYCTAAYGSNQIGVVFKIDSTGKETVLHTFGGSDGAYPSSGLVRDSKGTLYGTTEFGGSFGAGVAYSITSSGTFAVLHNFAGSDGADLLTPLVLDSAGNLYGTTTEGGAHGQGTVFKIMP
jgi:uncharacterized repeat protein (TIGR03803 family)